MKWQEECSDIRHFSCHLSAGAMLLEKIVHLQPPANPML